MSDGNEDPKTMRINALIDENLKRVFADMIDDDLPDRFKDLLDILSAQDADSAGPGYEN